MGGVLYDLGPHLIDQAIQLFGPPASVYAQIAARRPGARATDQFRLTLRFASGLTAVLSTDFLAAIPSPRFVVRGARGAFEKHGIDPQEAALRAGRAPLGDDWGMEPPAAWGRCVSPGRRLRSGIRLRGKRHDLRRAATDGDGRGCRRRRSRGRSDGWEADSDGETEEAFAVLGEPPPLEHAVSNTVRAAAVINEGRMASRWRRPA